MEGPAGMNNTKNNDRDPNDFGFATRAIHAGAAPDATTGARNTPIHHSTSYVFDDVEHAASLFNLQSFGFIYSRLTNPTVAVLEERIANLEGGARRLCRRLRPCSAVPGVFHAHGTRRSLRCLAQSLWRIDHAVRSELQKTRLAL
jgi:hypothetical protein